MTRTPRTLLVTNDFPPRPGGIQSYLENLTDRLDPDALTVYCSTFRGKQSYRWDAVHPYEVVREDTGILLPIPAVTRRAAELVRSHAIDTVWFGAAAPLALMAPSLRAAGARRIIASTHGHEVGWSMLPGSRQCLRRIGDAVDVVTYVSRYTRSRFAAAFGPRAALEWLPPGVDTRRFRASPDARAQIRRRHSLPDGVPIVLCLSRLVPRKGQDVLLRLWPKVLASHPDARLLIVGGGPRRAALEAARDRIGLADRVIITGGVAGEDLPLYHAAADVFAMPCRTRGGGLDVEGLGIVFLEAASSGVPVVAGDSGGAPETVVEGKTGFVVQGRDESGIAAAIVRLLDDPELARRLGRQGRAWAEGEWTWERQADRLAALLAPVDR